MPPTGVSISTCLSWPLRSFCTFTLHAGRSRSAARLAAAMTNAENLLLRMFRPSVGDGALDSRSPLRDIGNAHGKMTANGDFSKQRLDRRYLGDCRVGECTHIILDLREVCRQVRIPHGDHCSP